MMKAGLILAVALVTFVCLSEANEDGPHWSEWELLGKSCDKKCDRGGERFKRKCIGGKSKECGGSKNKFEKCVDLPPCASWGEWRKIGKCKSEIKGQKCGDGQQQYKRKCNRLKPGRKCPGDKAKLEACNIGPCATWGEWNDGECSASCGAGTIKSTRECEGIGKCKGDAEKSTDCNNGACATWGEWNDGECSTTCGAGTTTSTRECEELGECDGDAEKSTDCNKGACQKVEENEYPNWTHEKCTFPFEYSGKLYLGCTKTGGYDVPWCSFDAVYTDSWDYCKEQESWIGFNGIWGDWGAEEVCPDGAFAYGYSLKSESNQMSGDDSALNAVKLLCGNIDDVTYITSTEGPWGSYSEEVSCSSGYNNPITGFRMQIEGDQGDSDNSAANQVHMRCQDGKDLKANAATSWGDLTEYISCPVGQAVAGIKTRVEGEQGSEDDSALNGVRLFCKQLPTESWIGFDGIWGDWGTEEMCPDGEFAYGYSLKSESDQGSGDDTALNAVKLLCGNVGDVTYITSTEGPWGSYSEEVSCSGGHSNPITGFRMQIEGDQGAGDNSAANQVHMRCQDEQDLKASAATSWGDLTEYISCPAGQAVAGIKTRVEDEGGDDSALNGVLLFCKQLPRE